jgi:DNA modification methylase
MTTRRRTTTSNFGVGGRESHDASPFYDRFRAPEVSDDSTVLIPVPVADSFVHGDARHMDAIADGSVALVVTSPPYFAGKQYEEELEREGIPSSYLEYLEMLTDVFAECVRTLEPGGRIAVNVANLGRRPYRSLSADVIRILEHDLGLLLRGELIWQKGEGASGSCAWGSFRSAANPVLRDISERVIVASKGRFDRARTPKQRAAEGLPHENTLMTDDFLSLTLDIWSMPTESARRVGHPAPFPVELPEQLIRLYTYKNDLILDPFMGSGSTLVAAARLDRRAIGYDLDSKYVDISRARVAAELADLASTARAAARDALPSVPEVDGSPSGQKGKATKAASTVEPAGSGSASAPEVASRDELAREGTAAEVGATRNVVPFGGKAAIKIAAQVLEEAGFTDIELDCRVKGAGMTVSFAAHDAKGARWFFDVPGPFTTYRGGLQRTETVWKAIGQACVLQRFRGETPLVLLTSHLPKHRSEGDKALRNAGADVVFDVIDLLSASARDRLTRYAQGSAAKRPQPGFWTETDIVPAGRLAAKA